MNKPKKPKGGKKRKQQQNSQAEQKKPKLEDEEEGLTDKDKLTLNRWKGLQLDTRPFIHPIRKLVRTGEPDASYVQQQDMLIRQQFAEIENQQKQIVEYERMIKEQNSLIASLRDKHAALVLECQESGVKLSQELLSQDNCVLKSMGSSCQMLPPSHSNPGMPVQTRLSSLPPPHPPTSSSSSSSLTPASPANVFSPPMIQPAYPNISPTNRTPPPNIPPPLIRPPPPPPPPPHHTSVSMGALPNSSCVVDTVHVSNSSTYPLNPRQRMPMHQGHAQFIALDQPQILMGGGGGGGGGHTGHAQNQSHLPPGLRQQSFPRKNIHTSPPMLIDDITFSPLTSGELKGLEQANSYQPPPLVSYNEDLDSILNLSMLSGSGAGYGVGVKEEDLLQGSLQIDLRYVHILSVLMKVLYVQGFPQKKTIERHFKPHPLYNPRHDHELASFPGLERLKYEFTLFIRCLAVP